MSSEKLIKMNWEEKILQILIFIALMIAVLLYVLPMVWENRFVAAVLGIAIAGCLILTLDLARKDFRRLEREQKIQAVLVLIMALAFGLVTTYIQALLKISMFITVGILFVMLMACGAAALVFHFLAIRVQKNRTGG